MKDKIKIAAICWLVLACAGCGKHESKELDAEKMAVLCAGRLNTFVFAKRRWAKDRNAAPTDSPSFDDLAPYFRRGMRQCPEGGTYTIGAVAELPQCSIVAHNDYFKEHQDPPQ